ncbi:MAG: hypothetical protein Q9167_006057 [Letrouitia subvulpina]
MRVHIHPQSSLLCFSVILFLSQCSAKPLTNRQRHPANLFTRQPQQKSQPTLEPVSPSNILNISSSPSAKAIWLDTNPNFYYPSLPVPDNLTNAQSLNPLPIPANWSLYCPGPIQELCELIISPDTALPMAPKDQWVHIKNDEGGCEFSAWVPDGSTMDGVKKCADTGAQMITALVAAAGNSTQGPEAGLVNRASLNVLDFDGWVEGSGSQVDTEKRSLVLEA